MDDADMCFFYLVKEQHAFRVLADESGEVALFGILIDLVAAAELD